MIKNGKTDKEKADLVDQVNELRSQGFKMRKAVEKVGISDASYYTWKKQLPKVDQIGKEDLQGNKEKNTKDREHNKQVAELKKSENKLSPPPVSKISREDQERILEIKASFPHMGVKQLRQHLIRNHKLTYSERQIRQFLEREGVPKLKTAYPPQPVRRFERDLPNEMWQIDIMSFHVGATPLYLISFLDDHSRFIVSYSVCEEQSSKLVLNLLERAISFRKPLSIITDRGIQFCSWNGVTAFQMALQKYRIDHLTAREQHPETMGKIEAFHKTIKRELLTTTEFADSFEAKERIHDFIMFYNFARPHMGIDNQAPAERYFKKLMPFNQDAIYYRKITPRPKVNHGTQGRNKKTEKRN